MKPFGQVPLHSVIFSFKQWLTVLQSTEIGHAYFCPPDVLYRIFQFRSWCQTQHINVLLINLDAEPLDDVASFRQLLLETHKPIVLIARTFFMTNPDAGKFLSTIAHVRMENSIGVLIGHEGFPSQVRPILKNLATSLDQHHFIFPGYLPDAIDEFLDAKAKDWSITITKQQKIDIKRIAGGNLRLITDIARAIRDTKNIEIKDYVQTDSFTKKVDAFWEWLPEKHKQILIYESNNEAEKTSEWAEMIQAGIFLPNAPLPEYLQTCITNAKHHSLIIAGDTISYNGTDLKADFSKGERRILITLSKSPNQPVTREALGTAFWKDESNDKYSDWALDKTMSRIREKIKTLTLPITIETLRGKGYVFRYSN